MSFFSIESFMVFILVVLAITQIFARKISKLLDIFAIINTKIFLGILFILVISIYGILFRLLKIDLLRLKKQNNSYWLTIEKTDSNRIRKQY
jgi:hypothetical protein